MTRRVLDHLAGQGAERIALIAGPTQEYYSRASATAYRRWCSRAGVRPCVVPFDEDDSAGRGLDALLTGEGGPDAVFGLYDPCGRQILAAATRCGLSVPEDLMVVCGSEDLVYGRTVPPVSTVSLAPEQAGTAAVDALVSLVEDPPHTPPPVVIGTRLVVRSSSMRRSRRQAS
ncbi:substrate-binding domain-containing protein [Streptomyces sp. NPDC003442]